MRTLRQYLFTLTDPEGLTRRLGELVLCRDAVGRPACAVGNSAIVFRVRHEGRLRALRCFLRPMRHLREIYGERLFERELYLYTSPTTGEWVDVVLDEWIEGRTLREAVHRAASDGDREQLAALAAAFDRLALAMVTDDRAHGDLKPENLIVDPAALISTALHALAEEPGLYARYGAGDGLLFTPSQIPHEAPYREVVALFERRGMAVAYRIARLLTAPTLRLFGLEELLREAVRRQTEAERAEEPDEGPAPELFERGGLWGYRTQTECVIAPLYDNGFEFSEGLAAVQLGSTWHFIDRRGRTRISCPDCEAVKPFRNGRARIIRRGVRSEIDPAGREFAI